MEYRGQQQQQQRPGSYEQVYEEKYNHSVNDDIRGLFHGFWGLGFFRFVLVFIFVAAVLGAVFGGIAAFRSQPKCPTCILSAAEQLVEKSAASLPTLTVKLAIVGGGMGGVHTAFRAARATPNQVALVEATDQLCGIIRDTELVGSTANKPLRFGSHALRYPLGTMVPLRNLFNELGIPSYCNGFTSRWNLFGRQGDASYKKAIRAAWDLPNTPFGQYPSDPEYSALLYLLGAQQGNGVNINPLTGVDDYAAGNHPSQRCGEFKDTYSMYQAYFGETYANFICSVNVGFLGDCFGGFDPCGYLEWYNREWNTGDNCYPVGGFSEVCRRMRSNATQNGAKFFQNEPALSIETISGGRVRITTAQRIIVADQVVLGIAPRELKSVSGNVVTQILARPESKAPKPINSVTIAAQYSSAWWRDAGIFSDNANYRLLQVGGGCFTRLEAHNNPYASLHNTIRVVYTDYQCVDVWKALLALPESALRAELSRSLKRAFPAANITEPIKVFGEWEEAAWYYNSAGATFTPEQVFQWARAPLGNNVPVCLANHAYRVVDSGWSVASVRTSAQCLNRFNPNVFTETTLQNWETAYGRITPGYDGEMLAPSALANEIFDWNATTTVQWSVPPFSYRTLAASVSSAADATTTTDADGNTIPTHGRPQGH